MKPSGVKWQELHRPLLFDIPMTRAQCYEAVRRAGLPEPPKSSCWMCPYRGDAQWKRLKEHYPEDFAKAIQLDREISERDERGGVFLHRKRVPLSEVDFSEVEERTSSEGDVFGEVEHCDSGSCWV